MSRRRRRTNVINLESTLNELLAEYGDDVYEALDKTTGDIAYDSVQKLRAVRRFAPDGHPSGEYSASWTNEKQPVSRLQTREVIYNEDHYRLTHLLENGHVIRNGTGRSFGRAPAYPHIIQVEQWAREEFVKRVREGISKL